MSNICQKLIEEAITSNMQAIKLVLDRVLPPKRNRAIDVNRPKLQTIDDAVNAISIIIDAVGSGEITPSEGEAISRVVDVFIKTLQEYEIEKRVSMLEQGLKK